MRGHVRAAATRSEYVDGRRRRPAPLPGAGPRRGRHRSMPTAVAGTLAPFKGHRMAKAALEMARARRRAAGRGPLASAVPRRGPRTGAVRGLGRDHGLDPGSCSTPSAATSTRATCGSSSRSSRAGTSSRCAPCASASATTCCSRSTPTRPTPSPTPRHLARLDPFDLLLIEQPLAEDDVRRPRRAGPADPHAGLPRRVDRLGPGRRGRHRARAPARSSTSSPAGSAATSRRAASTTSASRTACRCGAAACSRPASGGPPTSPWPRCPTSRCPATPRRRTATTAPTSPRRSCSTTATWACRPGRGSASAAGRRARRGHHRHGVAPGLRPTLFGG